MTISRPVASGNNASTGGVVTTWPIGQTDHPGGDPVDHRPGVDDVEHRGRHSNRARDHSVAEPAVDRTSGSAGRRPLPALAATVGSAQIRSTRGARSANGSASIGVVTISSNDGLMVPPTVDQTSLARLLSCGATDSWTVPPGLEGLLASRTWLARNEREQVADQLVLVAHRAGPGGDQVVQLEHRQRGGAAGVGRRCRSVDGRSRLLRRPADAEQEQVDRDPVQLRRPGARRRLERDVAEIRPAAAGRRGPATPDHCRWSRRSSRSLRCAQPSAIGPSRGANSVVADARERLPAAAFTLRSVTG